MKGRDIEIITSHIICVSKKKKKTSGQVIKMDLKQRKYEWDVGDQSHAILGVVKVHFKLGLIKLYLFSNGIADTSW